MNQCVGMSGPGSERGSNRYMDVGGISPGPFYGVRGASYGKKRVCIAHVPCTESLASIVFHFIPLFLGAHKCTAQKSIFPYRQRWEKLLEKSSANTLTRRD